MKKAVKRKKLIYFDYNATTPVRPEVAGAMAPYLDPEAGLWGNPSSVHFPGQEARRAVEDARAGVARFLGASPEEIIFTSCGTESDTAAIKGAAFAAKERGKGGHIITSSIEHDCVLFCCEYLRTQGWDVTFLPVDSSGLVDPDEVKKAIRKDTVLVSVMHANNETGVIEPVAEIGRICREREVVFHSDGIQSAGKIPTRVSELNADLFSLSAHKLYGPKGVGVLYARKGTRLHPLFHGHHERGRRAGTENVAGIVGCAAACELAGKDMVRDAEKVAKLRDRLEEGILRSVPCVFRNGPKGGRIPGTSNLSFEYVEGEGCVMLLDLEGIAVSTGSACASGTTKASHVLRAMGVPGNLAQGALRFSLGHFNSGADVDAALEAVPRVAAKLRSMSPLWEDRTKGVETRITPPDRFLGLRPPRP